ncbi:hypothetical protein NKG94_14360 [Micromonospora sp. M12]
MRCAVRASPSAGRASPRGTRRRARPSDRRRVRPGGLRPRHRPARPGADAERTLVAAAEWLVRDGGFTVWLAGGRLRDNDRVRSVPMLVPARFAELASVAEQSPASVAEQEPRVLTWPPIAGVPRATARPSRRWNARSHRTTGREAGGGTRPTSGTSSAWRTGWIYFGP